MAYQYFLRYLGQWLLVLLVACVSPLALGEEPLLDEDRQAIQWVINGQISAFRADDAQSAYSFAAPNVRQVFPTEEMFISMVQRDYMPLYRPVSYRFGRSSLEEGEVLQELLVTDSERQLWQIIYTLEQQDDLSWKVTNVLMLPYKGVSA